MLNRFLHSNQIHLWAKLLLCSLAYYVLGKIGVSLALINNSASPVWPAAGFAVACIYLGGAIYALPVYMGSFVVNLFTPNIDPGTAMMMSTGNLFEGLIGAAILKLIIERSSERSWSFPIGILVASFVSSAIGATIGNFALVVGKVIPFEFADHSWVTWWIGDSIGILLLVPILLTAQERQYRLSIRLMSAPQYLVILLGLLLNYFIFLKHVPESLYLLHNLVVFILALSVGYPIAIFYVILISVSSIVLMTNGQNPFSLINLNDQLIETQVFIGLMAITALFVERKRVPKFNNASFLFMNASWVLAAAFLQYLIFADNRAQDLELAKVKSEVVKSVEKTELIFATALDGGVALFSASQNVTKDEWKGFVEKLNLPIKYPGILGLGVIDRVKSKELNQYRKFVQNTYTADFEIHPVPGRTLDLSDTSEHYIINFIEPLNFNRAAQGLAISSDPIRKFGADKSTQLDKAVTTNPISIVQLNPGSSAGLIYRPVYKKGLPLHSVQQRQAAVERWVYAPFSFESLFGTLLNQFDGIAKIDIQTLQDGAPLYNLSNQKLTHIQEENLKKASVHLNFFELPIKINVTYLGRFTGQSNANRTLYIFLLGFSILLVFRIISMLEGFKARAEKLIDLRTKQFKEEIEKNKAIFQSAKFAIITTDLSGKINSLNQEAERILKYSASELIGEASILSLHDKIELDKRSDHLSMEYSMPISSDFDSYIYKIKDGEAEDRHWTFIAKDSTRVQVHVSLTCLRDQHGGIKGFLAIARDLTQELEMQKTIDLQQIKLLTSSKMASLGEVAAGIAHEINNPLSIIQGWVELLLLNIEESKVIDKAKIVDHLDKIKAATLRAAHIIKSLKSLSRNAEADPMIPVDLVFATNEALELFKQRFILKNISISVNASPSLKVLGRQSQIMQIITNLLNNSFDAIQNYEEKWIHIFIATQGSMVRFVITDSGAGIEQSVREKLMQPFFTTKEVGKGTGLGLSISRQIAEQHGGRLYLDPEQKHTCFVLELQLCEQAQKAA